MVRAIASHSRGWSTHSRIRVAILLTVAHKQTTEDALAAVVIRMPADLHQAVKNKAASEERSMAQAIRYALKQYVQTA